MPKLTELQERERATWQYRAVALLRGNQTLPGCILLAALGLAASNPPTLGLTAVIDEDGFLYSDFVDRERNVHEALRIGAVEDVVNAFRRVIDELHLNDGEVKELFDTIRKWIERDERAINNMAGDHD